MTDESLGKIIRIDKTLPFPTIDLKVQNTGVATACIWRLTVDVIEYKEDKSPWFSFALDVSYPEREQPHDRRDLFVFLR